MAHTSEDHGHTLLISSGNHLVIAQAATGLNHAARAGRHHRIKAVTKGKNASLATTLPCKLKPECPALITAMRAESSRLICPAPTAKVIPAWQKTIALLFTNFATLQANSRSCI